MDIGLDKTEILVVGDNLQAGEVIGHLEFKKELRLTRVDSDEEALDIFDEKPFDLVIISLDATAIDGLLLLTRLLQKHSQIKVILIVENGDVRTYMKAFYLGAYDCFFRPMEKDNFINVLTKATNYNSYEH